MKPSVNSQAVTEQRRTSTCQTSFSVLSQTDHILTLSDCEQTTIEEEAMVRKTCHNGVHSGNTLRAFNSRYSRRYHNQACIVTRVRPELLRKLQEQQELGGPTAAKLSDGKKKPVERLGNGNANVAVNVALSLNKQARWLLPSALIQQVQTNDIADSELTVSVLERHKLKKTASCVSFHSNKGEVTRIQPRNGRYFGFVFPRADGKSKRNLRIERREQLLKSLESNKVKTRTGKAMEVFTEQGSTKRDLQLQEEMGESEVRYEVYYPSPASSSIAHNPKYIKQDTDVAFGDGDEHVQHGKPKKQHRGQQRKRMTLKDIEDWDVAAYHSEPHHTLTTISHMVDPQEFSSLCNVKEERNTAECLLSSLIEKAQRLQNFKGTAVKPRGNKNRACMKEDDDKSHIVYLSESPESFVQNQKSHGKSEESFPSIHPVSAMPSECSRVLLPKDDVSNASLKEYFGECYAEVGCKPRKFILDVTPSVQELLKKQGVQAKVAEQTEEAVSYVICIHDGFYNDEYDVYRVLLNSKLHEGLLSVDVSSQDQQDLFRGTVMNLISQTMDFMQDLVTSLKQKKRFPLFVQDQTAKASRHHLSNHLGSSEIYVPSVKRVLQLGSTDSDITVPALSDMVQEEPIFCDVCYDDISPLTHGSTPSTSLPTCNHHVCDSCWSQHVHVRLHEGFVRVTCPGYDCQEEVKVGLLVSVAPMNTVEKLLQRQEEVRIGASQTEKWCPNESCGRVISLKPSSSSGGLQFQQDVVCVCGTHVCFQCMMPAHWPASCQQALDYRASLTTAVFPDRLAEIHDDSKAEELAREKRKQEERKLMLVEGKQCPRCKSFFSKNGGCSQMTCRCGQLFCWYCAKPGPAHDGCVSEKLERKVTTTIVVHHLQQKKNPDDTEQQQHQSPSGNRRRRMSMMERAVEHRKHRENNRKNSRAIAILAKAVASAAAKNKALTQHLARVCSGACPASVSQRPVTVLEMISTFLKNSDHSRHELLEVVEYSLVLLKDLPDSLLRRRALRISEDLSAFCSFSQSIFDVWGKAESSPQSPPHEAAVKGLMRLAEIQDWVNAALNTHVVTVKKLRGTS